MSDNTRASSIKAVGFAFFSPEVVVMFADHEGCCVHVHSSKNGKSLDLSDSRNHLVILRSLDQRHSLADVGDRIHRLLVFGKPDDLLALGLPLLDATVDDGGKIIPLHRQSRDTMLSRIEDDAVPLSLLSVPSSSSLPKKEAPEPPVNMSFVARLRALRAEVKGAGSTIDFVADIGMPAVLRIMDDYTREQIKDSCKKMVTEGGVSEGSAREFYRWIEGIGYEISGLTLGSALERFLYSKDELDTDVDALAERFGVDKTDIEFVAQSYRQLLQEEKE